MAQLRNRLGLLLCKLFANSLQTMIEIHATNPYNSIAKHHGMHSVQYSTVNNAVDGLLQSVAECHIRSMFKIATMAKIVFANTVIMPVGQRCNAYLATFEVQSIKSAEPAID